MCTSVGVTPGCVRADRCVEGGRWRGWVGVGMWVRRGVEEHTCSKGGPRRRHGRTIGNRSSAGGALPTWTERRSHHLGLPLYDGEGVSQLRVEVLGHIHFCRHLDAELLQDAFRIRLETSAEPRIVRGAANRPGPCDLELRGWLIVRVPLQWTTPVSDDKVTPIRACAARPV
jgi:hypothetical protein